MSQPHGPEFDNSYARLPDRFYARQAPEPVRSPGLIRANQALAQQLGIDVAWLESEEGLQVLAGNTLAPGSDPIATVYAAHQFGGWNPQLGDGRAVLLGEVVDRRGQRYDLQLKGSGRTPYSRGGDGRAPLGPVLREYVVSEAMAVLGVPTSRALAAVTTGETVYRDRALPGGVLTRVSSSHIRIGTFQFFAARDDHDAVRVLADHVIQRHYPDAATAERPYLALLEGVIARQAELIAHWQQLGFIHGVMNTDNMLVSGETVDYGPCAFMDRYDPKAVFSSIDSAGRYAYANQPGIGQWNLAWLARALLPIIDPDESRAVELAQQAIDGFVARYKEAYAQRMCAKLGIARVDDEAASLVDDLLERMTTAGADYTLTFRRLAELAAPNSGFHSVEHIFTLPDVLEPWLERWRELLERETSSAAQRQQQMLLCNPAFIPRNHLIEEVIQAAVERGDFDPFHRLVERLARPGEYAEADARYAMPPRPEEMVLQTFCGT
ncbi:YdiU family protein [Halopseudomonas nanhaiensis]|uniref:protein adenylyltransferase SelO n=1 Tax=Halopseudomonas nanhaiensis TaxID=2830842 RepID=UPI001CC11048|nr:YdiU family protein [Halopseudomonas nanhaiensis]UAW97269.1 YdiU family protein [Halopseudomonas nanhaiensis]